MAKRLAPYAATAFGILAAIAVAWGVFEFARDSATSQDSGDEGGVIRWRNVQLAQPTNPGLHVGRLLPPRPGDPWIVEVSALGEPADGPDLRLRIDADTGEILLDTLSATSSADVQALIVTLEIGPSDYSAWPYADAPVPTKARVWGRTTYLEPNPASGIVVLLGSNYCTTSDCASESLQVTDGYTTMHVNADTGEAKPPEAFPWASADQVRLDAFVRYAESILLTSGNVQPTP